VWGCLSTLQTEFILFDILCIYISNVILFPPHTLLPHPLILWRCSHFPPTTPTSTPWHSPTLAKGAFTGPRASPPIDARQCHPLLHMRLESWVLLCLLFGWWCSPWELGGVVECLVDWYCCSSYGVANKHNLRQAFLDYQEVFSLRMTRSNWLN